MLRNSISVFRLASLLVFSLSFFCLVKTSYSVEPTERSKKSIWQIELEQGDDGKYLIEASVFAIGDPVHETITLQALIDGGIVNGANIDKDAKAKQIIRGVFWNDDPCAQLFAKDDFKPLKPSFGKAWFIDFQNAKKLAKNGSKFERLNCTMLGRSHFGDLQFLHSMANKDLEKASATVKLILDWASIAYRIATDAIDTRAPLNTDAVANALISELADMSAMQLFLAKTSEEVKSRALGSLLHMIQDSYAGGHVKRNVLSSDMPISIIQFLSYANQDAKKHEHDDKWRNGTNDLEKTLAIPGASNALVASTQLVKMYKNKSTWLEVQEYLESDLFSLDPNVSVSGPGDYE